ncbi:hypothetical protein [Candidatus Electronema sp. JC]|uniref:hypothetical protein n=1 Tax=Candidatus Electronema sp. JC TaxID=3401570 RepID=UPI003B43B788
MRNFSCGNKELHRSILIANSDFFRAMPEIQHSFFQHLFRRVCWGQHFHADFRGNGAFRLMCLICRHRASEHQTTSATLVPFSVAMANLGKA